MSAFRKLLREHPPVAEPLDGEPEDMLIDEVEAIWSAIDTGDDWAPFHAKLARIETLGRSLGHVGQAGTPPPSPPFSRPP